MSTAAAVIGVAGYAASVLLDGVTPLPRSIPFIYLLLALTATAHPRLFARLFTYLERQRTGRTRTRPAVVMGAGDAGGMIVRELQRNPQVGFEVVGFLDDDPAKQGQRIYGVCVLGDRHAIPQVVREYDVQQMIIAMPTAPGKEIREIIEICEQADIHTKIIPGIYELLDGTVSVNQLRNVQIEDLLRREPVQTDIADVEAFLRNRRVLVTGGGGSIGSELCRQILRCEPAELVILGHGENSIFKITNELHNTQSEIRIFHLSRHRRRPLSRPPSVHL